MDASLLVPAQANGEADVAEPLTADEAEESDAAWRSFLAGDDAGESLDRVRQTLLATRSSKPE